MLRVLSCRSCGLCRPYGLYGLGTILSPESPGKDQEGCQGDECIEYRAFQAEIASCYEQIALCLRLQYGRQGKAADPESQQGPLEKIPTYMEEEGEPQVAGIDVIDAE